jgi:lipocalin
MAILWHMLPHKLYIMKTEIEMLTSYVGLLIMNRPGYPGLDMLTTIKTECARLKDVFNISFNHTADSFQFTEAMNSRYTKLVGLANILWERARLPNPFARLAMMEVLAVKYFLEYEYRSFLDADRGLTSFERFKLEHRVLSELKVIKGHLRAKKISEALILQLEKVFLDLFKESKYPVLSVSKKEYVEALLTNLSAMAIDERDKDWNARLRLLLVKLNCNHLGIYKLLQAEQEKEILMIRDPEKQYDLLYAKEIWIKQIQMERKLAYNTDVDDLKSMLLKQIKMLGPHLRKKMERRAAVKPEKVKYKLSVDELSVVFHSYYLEKVFDYPSKKAAAEAICENIRSVGTADISANSLLKYDRLEQRSAALNYYRRSSRILEQLKIDFDL